MSPKNIASPAWTEAQLAAIRQKGEILVSAAAGSGKTAVLIERILRLITDPAEKVGIDQLLVVTFTNAAAQEMRERMSSALEKSIFQNSANADHLIRQLALLPQAYITTLHSFCLSLLRQYFYLIDLDPGFRVADEGEINLLREDVIDELFDDCYEQGNPIFFHLVEGFGSDRDDRSLVELIHKIYQFAYSQADPFRWLQTLSIPYNEGDLSSLLTSPWGKAVSAETKDTLAMALLSLTQAGELCTATGGPVHYLPVIEEEVKGVRHLLELLETDQWEAWEKTLATFEFLSLPRGKKAAGEGLERELREKAGGLRNNAKKSILTLKKNHTFFLAEQIPMLNESGKLVEGLAFLVSEFASRFAQKKKERNIIDFTDMEHFTLKLLQGDNQPSLLAHSFKSQFVQVLVDEYQDINPAQERILQLLSRLDGENPNLFMVGDVKQSIYRFRMADPTLFLRKYNHYPHYDGDENTIDDENALHKVIDLTQNFRSRTEIVDGVNFIFKNIMFPQVGELIYDDYAALRYGAAYPDSGSKLSGGPIEFHLVDKSSLTGSGVEEKSATGDYDDSDSEAAAAESGGSGSDDSGEQIEARLVAQHIRRLISDPDQVIFDKSLNDYRPIKYSDIVILMRSYSSLAPVYGEALKQAGIPVFSASKQGYFANTEVETVLAYLQIIDNPHQDIPLASVLRSPMVGMSGAELGFIRALLPEGDYFEAMALLLKGLTDNTPAEDWDQILFLYQDRLPELLSPVQTAVCQYPELGQKITRFWHQFKALRTYAVQHSLAELIWRIYEDTGYLSYVGTLPGGEQRQANLRLLYDRACRFETTHYRGLFRFLRFLERFKENKQDWGDARTLGENEDVVRFMTVHGSKGLEFPVVFLVGLGRNFNLRSSQESVLLHPDYGIGIPNMDIEKRVHYPSFIRQAVQKVISRENRAEEMRVLYVALTRAKERLFLYGNVRNLASAVAQWRDIRQGGEESKLYYLCNAKSFLDWIGVALAHHPADPLTGGSGENDSEPSLWLVYPHQSIPDIEQELKAELLVSAAGEKEEDQAEEIACRLNWKYPYPTDRTALGKTSVSELKGKTGRYYESGQGAALFQQEEFSAPQFIHPQAMSSAERGTAIHTILQHLPLGEWKNVWADKETQVLLVENFILTMQEKEILTPYLLKGIDSSFILNLLNSAIGQKLFSAQEVRREVPFIIGLTPRDKPPVLVQGIIDVLLLHPSTDTIEIIDYKTDHVDKGKGAAILVDRYLLQMAIYAYAAESLLKKTVDSCIIYSFALEEGITLSRSQWQDKLKENFILP